MHDRVEREIGEGRLWRAKEILRGRLAGAGYNSKLFGRIAHVLADMRDDDEAGRFFLLAGETGGEGGMLARAFLRRRSATGFAQLWADMPAAARRCKVEQMPAGTLQLLREAGFEPRAIASHLEASRRQREKQQAIREKARRNKPEEARGQRIGLAMGAILLVVLTVGVIGTVRLLVWAITSLTS